jgi:hypothetical protein
MNIYDLIARREALDCEAHENEMGMGFLIEAHQAIENWLTERGVPPAMFSAQPHYGDPGLQLIYTFRNDALARFAALEGEFWHFVQKLMPLDDGLLDKLRTQDKLPLATAEFREEDWDVVVVPDLYSNHSKFPSMLFWQHEAAIDDVLREQIASNLRQQRVRHALAELARADVY